MAKKGKTKAKAPAKKAAAKPPSKGKKTFSNLKTSGKGKAAPKSKVPPKKLPKAIKTLSLDMKPVLPRKSLKDILPKGKELPPRKATKKEVKAALKRAGLTPDLKVTTAVETEAYITDKKGTRELILPKSLKTQFIFKDGWKPSPQQGSIFRWVQNSTGNVFVRARAGTGKTTTIIRAVNFMHGRIMCITFNKKIEVELNRRLVEAGLRYKAQAATAHALGFRTLRRVYQNTVLNEGNSKNVSMLDRIKPIGSTEFPPALRACTLKLVSMAKQTGVNILWQPEDQIGWDTLCDHYNIWDSLENEADMPRAIKFAREGLEWALHTAPTLINFDDMIWVPLVHNMEFDKYDWVAPDEAQDLSRLRQLIVQKIMHDKTRLLAVGDERQAIYGFAGADTDSVATIIQDFNCQQLPLTVTYRCSKNIVKEAQKIVPDIQAHEENEIGPEPADMAWDKFEKEEMLYLTPDDAVLCRNNKQLASLAFRLIRKGIACHVEGRNIGEGLITLSNKWRVASVEELEDRLDAYLARERDKLSKKGNEAGIEAVEDKVETLKVLMEGCGTIRQLHEKIDKLFKDTDGNNKQTVTLATVHRAKGREWERVFVLGFKELMPSHYAKLDWELEQEDNLIYVAQTRAKLELIYLQLPPKENEVL